MNFIIFFDSEAQNNMITVIKYYYFSIGIIKVFKPFIAEFLPDCAGQF